MVLLERLQIRRALTNEIQSSKLLDETHPTLNRFVVGFQWRKEQSKNNTNADDLSDSRHQYVWSPPDVDGRAT